jgi:hypothetical protein
LYVIAETAGERARQFRPRARLCLLLACLLTLLSGCQLTAAPDPTPVPTALPTVTPTSEVTFQVAVTPIPPHKQTHPKPTPRPTRFVVPHGPYILLHPNSGPPVDETIVVTGGNFPHNAPVSILWALTGRLTPLSTTGYTDAHGALRATLSIPASAPGLYRVEAEVQGVPYARANYRIASAAALAASIVPAAGGGTLSIIGKKFVPGFQLVLIAYSTVNGRKPVVLGNVQVNSRGRFTFSGPIDKLQPGQYILRAWSNSSVAAEMAQTFFEVVV